MRWLPLLVAIHFYSHSLNRNMIPAYLLLGMRKKEEKIIFGSFWIDKIGLLTNEKYSSNWVWT